MSYKIILSDSFQKRSKRLAKKFPSLKTELLALLDELATNPTLGTPIGNGFYKIRLAVKSKGSGKRSGMRLITFVYVLKETIALFTIYDKSEQANVNDKELNDFLKTLKLLFPEK